MSERGERAMTPGRLPLKLWASMIQEHGIEVVVTGDMDLVGTMQRNWIEECGEECGVDACLPLWQADRAELLRKLLHEVRLLSVDAPSRLQGRPWRSLRPTAGLQGRLFLRENTAFRRNLDRPGAERGASR